MKSSVCQTTEGFKLMIYRDQVTGEEEVIWNSRDGITPFIVTSRAGNEAYHVRWNEDVYAPDHTPKAGDRIFIDLTLQRAKEQRKRYVDRWWDTPCHGALMSEQWPSKDAAIDELAAGDLESFAPHTPDLIVVTEEMIATRKWEERDE